MALNPDQFHVVRRDRVAKPGSGTGKSERLDTEWGVVHTPDNGDPKLVGFADYSGSQWTTPENYDRAFDRAEVGETPPLFTRGDALGVESMAIHPDFQRQGLGRMLSNHIAEEHWRQHPDETGDVPPHTSLSSAADSLVSRFTGDDPHFDDGGHWDSFVSPEDLGIHEDDYTDEETGEVDHAAMEDDFEYARNEHSERERERFAIGQLRNHQDLLKSFGAHVRGGGSTAPGTPVEDTGSIFKNTRMQVAPPTERSVEENSAIAQYGGMLPETAAPETRRKKGPDLQMRLPGV